MWSVSTILMGLQAFMLDSAPTLGSIETSAAQKRKLAQGTMAFNLTNSVFVQLFPEFVEEEEERRKKREENGEGGAEGGGVGLLGGLFERVGGGEAGGGRARQKVGREEVEPSLSLLLICVSITLGVLAIILRLSG